MRHIKFEDSPVLRSFAEIATKQGLLDKEPNYLYPNYDISEKNDEINVPMSKIASAHSEFYGVTSETGEQLVGKAHPGGGPKVEPAAKDLGKVETIVEQQKKNKEVALKMPTGKIASLMEKLVSLADHLDERGFEVLALDLDSQIDKLAAEAFAPAQLPAGALEVQHKPFQSPAKGPPMKPGEVAEMNFSPEEIEKFYKEYEAEKQKNQAGAVPAMKAAPIAPKV